MMKKSTKKDSFYSRFWNKTWQDMCHQWSTRPDPQSPGSSDHYSRFNFVLFCQILKSDGRTDYTCQNSDHYRPWLWVGLVDQQERPQRMWMSVNLLNIAKLKEKKWRFVIIFITCFSSELFTILVNWEMICYYSPSLTLSLKKIMYIIT